MFTGAFSISFISSILYLVANVSLCMKNWPKINILSNESTANKRQGEFEHEDSFEKISKSKNSNEEKK